MKKISESQFEKRIGWMPAAKDFSQYCSICNSEIGSKEIYFTVMKNPYCFKCGKLVSELFDRANHSQYRITKTCKELNVYIETKRKGFKSKSLKE